LLVPRSGERARLDLGQSVSETPTTRLKVSREGIVLIKSFEGFRPRATQREDGRWVIGYGHTASAREGLTVAEADAELLLRYDLMPVVKALNEEVHSPLNQHQFDALASFAISVGVARFLASDVLQRLNEGHALQAADALIGWPEDISADARLRRRSAERALFVADPASPVTLAALLAAPLPTAGPEAAAPDPAPPPAVPPPEPPVVQAPDVVKRVNLDRYSPYAAAIIGPLPGFATEEPVVAPVFPAEPEPELAAPEPEPQPEPQPEPASASEPEPADTGPVIPLVSAAPLPSPFPAMASELVLTPATEADFIEPERPVWPSDQRAPEPVDAESVLFEDEPTLSVLRHEVEPAGPRRFDWSETGAFLIMGGVGLAACGASAAAFRLAVEQPSPMGETTVIAWALALIGVICVGVSSWNLYVRWGKPD
jgi:lysozyme